MVLAVIVGLWVARYLGPEKFGQLNYALAFVAMAGPLAELGFESVLRREFVRMPETAPLLAGTAMGLRCAGALIAIGGIVACASAPAVIGGDKRLLLILALTLFQPSAMVCEVWLQSRLEARRSVLPQWVALGMGAGLRVLAIALHASIEVFAAIVVLEIGVGTILVVRSAKKCGFRISSIDRTIAFILLRECWPLALSSVSVVIYMRIDVLMLRWMIGDGAAGNYSAAVRLSELAYCLPLITAVSVQPMLVRAYQEGQGIYLRRLKVYFDLSALGAYAMALPITLLAPHLVAWAYGPSYASATPVLTIHAWASVFVFLGVARSQHLVNAGLSRFSLMSTLAGALTNVGLNLVLIPRWAGMGAAVATVVSYGVSAWLSSFVLPSVRPSGILQTKALLAPITAWKYLCKT